MRKKLLMVLMSISICGLVCVGCGDNSDTSKDSPKKSEEKEIESDDSKEEDSNSDDVEVEEVDILNLKLNFSSVVAMEVEDTPDGVEDFEDVYININGTEVVAWKKEEYLVFYGSVTVDESYEGWIMFNNVTKEFIRYSSFMGEDKYISYSTGDDKSSSPTTEDCKNIPDNLPEGFEDCFVNINGTEYPAMQYDDYIIMLADGPSGLNWYIYDKKYGGIMSYRAYTED